MSNAHNGLFAADIIEWILVEVGSVDLDDMRQVVEQLRRDPDPAEWMCCPLCEEARCDTRCPMARFRRVGPPVDGTKPEFRLEHYSGGQIYLVGESGEQLLHALIGEPREDHPVRRRDVEIQIGADDRVIVDKEYGPLIFWPVRVTPDFATGSWLIERQWGDVGWREVARIPGQVAADFCDPDEDAAVEGKTQIELLSDFDATRAPHLDAAVAYAQDGTDHEWGWYSDHVPALVAEVRRLGGGR